MPKGHKIIEETETEPAKKSAPPPDKPDSDEETRLYQVTLSGKNPDGKNVVYGTQKVWYTKRQAKSQGFHWADEPFIAKTRSGSKSR